MGGRDGEERHDMLPTYGEQPPCLIETSSALLRGARRPVEFAILEGRTRIRIGNLAYPLVAILEGGEAGEFAPPSVTHRLCQFTVKIREEEEGARLAIFLAHEQQ